jgi:hypothetical protein
MGSMLTMRRRPLLLAISMPIAGIVRLFEILRKGEIG